MIDTNKLSFAQKLKLREYLRVTCEYSERETMQAVSAVERMNPDLQADLMEYLVTGRITPVVVEGVTVTDLMEKAGMNPVTAFLSLDYLKTDPEEAKYILTRKKEELVVDEKRVEEYARKYKLRFTGVNGQRENP